MPQGIRQEPAAGRSLRSRAEAPGLRVGWKIITSDFGCRGLHLPKGPKLQVEVLELWALELWILLTNISLKGVTKPLEVYTTYILIRLIQVVHKVHTTVKANITDLCLANNTQETRMIEVLGMAKAKLPALSQAAHDIRNL